MGKKSKNSNQKSRVERRYRALFSGRAERRDPSTRLRHGIAITCHRELEWRTNNESWRRYDLVSCPGC